MLCCCVKVFYPTGLGFPLQAGLKAFKTSILSTTSVSNKTCLLIITTGCPEFSYWLRVSDTQSEELNRLMAMGRNDFLWRSVGDELDPPVDSAPQNCSSPLSTSQPPPNNWFIAPYPSRWCCSIPWSTDVEPIWMIFPTSPLRVAADPTLSPIWMTHSTVLSSATAASAEIRSGSTNGHNLTHFFSETSLFYCILCHHSMLLWLQSVSDDPNGKLRFLPIPCTSTIYTFNCVRDIVTAVTIPIFNSVQYPHHWYLNHNNHTHLHAWKDEGLAEHRQWRWKHSGGY